MNAKVQRENFHKELSFHCIKLQIHVCVSINGEQLTWVIPIRARQKSSMLAHDPLTPPIIGHHRVFYRAVNEPTIFKFFDRVVYKPTIFKLQFLTGLYINQQPSKI